MMKKENGSYYLGYLGLGFSLPTPINSRLWIRSENYNVRQGAGGLILRGGGLGFGVWVLNHKP